MSVPEPRTADAAEPEAQALLPAPLRTRAEDEQFSRQLDDWLRRLLGLGIQCRDLALQGLGPGRDRDFSSASPELQAAWRGEAGQVGAQLPLRQQRLGDELLVALWLPPAGHAAQRQDGVRIGLWISPPYGERTLAQVQLATGWLQLILAADLLVPGRRAAQLLELLAQVQAQSAARAGAQEWINRSAAWVRAEVPGSTELALTLFEQRRDRPHWWVSSDQAWVEPAAAGLEPARELAEAVLAEQRELTVPGGWATPLQRDGRIEAVLVARQPGAVPPDACVLLRACATLGEPLLARWREAERPLWRHALQSLQRSWQHLHGPGYWRWKLGASLGLLLVLLLTLWPVDDRVTAPLVIEGRLRQLVTAPQEGFLTEVLVRPGDRVSAGQLLARLDDRDLQLERQRQLGAREQAAAKLRQALGEHEAAAARQASAELQSAQAQLNLAEAKLARTELRAPLAGLVVSGDWVQQIGTPLETGKELFELAADPGLRVVLHVPDRDIARIRSGQPGELRLAGQPQQGYDFSVSQITATASVREGVNGFRVEAAWSGAAPALSPGMQGVGKVVVGRANLLTLWTRPLLDWLRLRLWSLWW
jgi:biotin carboxyl carrier protein